jgi:DNA-binding NarL/FixJ family response regulator
MVADSPHCRVGWRGATVPEMANLLRGRGDFRSLFEAALSDGTDDSWAMGISRVAERLFEGACGVGVQFARFDRRPPIDVRIVGVGTVGNIGPLVMPIIEGSMNVRSLGHAQVRNIFRPSSPAAMFSSHLRRLGLEPRAHLGDFGAKEVGAVFAPSSAARLVMLLFQVEREYALTPHEQRLLNTLSLYLSLGVRSRNAGVAGGVFTPTGELVDGCGVAPARFWAGLCAGRLGLLRRGHGAARHFVVIQNARLDWPRRALTPVEQRVLELAARGVPGKNQASELGIATTTASRLLNNASAKLGFHSLFDAIRLVAGLIETGERAPVSGLTDAEREVVALIREGLSNRGIAERRDVSERTVANQVAAVLRKTQLPSRRALAAAS